MKSKVHPKLQAIIDRYPEIVLHKADGFDDAILGVAYLWSESGRRTHALCYDADKCLGILMKRDKMTRDEAEEYFVFNVEGAYVGMDTPVFIWRA